MAPFISGISKHYRGDKAVRERCCAKTNPSEVLKPGAGCEVHLGRPVQAIDTLSQVFAGPFI